MDKERVQRMLALGKEKQARPLCDEELKELSSLRAEYLRDFRAGVRQQLDHVYIQQEDGSYQKLRRKDDPASVKE